MASLLGLPTENILEIAEYLAEPLSKRDVVSLYSTCRHFREILVTSIRREFSISIDSMKMVEMANFSMENSYFARSISVMRLTSTDLPTQPSKSKRTVIPFVEKVAKELEVKHPESYNEFKDVLSLGNGLSYTIIWLIALERLEYFYYIEKSDDTKLKMAVLALLSSGRYLQRLKRFKFIDRRREEKMFEHVMGLYDINVKSKKSKATGSRSLVRSKDAQLRFPQVVNKSALEEIHVYDENFDMNFLQFLAQIPTSLKVLDLHYVHYIPSGSAALSTLRRVISMQAGSIQRIDIFLDPVKLSKDQSRGSGRMDGDRLGYLQNCVALKRLKVPVDALLGTNNNPKKGNTIPSWSRNLPSSLTDLFLDLGFFRTQDSTLLWTSSQILKGLIIGTADLLDRCPDLRKMRIACLSKEDFERFQRVVTNRVKDLEFVYDDAMERDDPSSVGDLIDFSNLRI